MPPGRSEQHNPQRLVAGNAACLVVKPPTEDSAHMLINQITLDGLWRLVKNPVVTNGTAQLYIFRVGPDQWASGTGGLAAKELERGNVGDVPDLFGQEAALPGGRIFHYGKKCLCLVAVPGRQGVMGALSGKQRPRAANARPVEGGAIFMLTVAVSVVAIPARSLRQLDRQQRVNGPKRVQNARVIGRAQAKPHQSESIGADDVVRTHVILTRRTILDRNETQCRRRKPIGVRRSDAHIVAI